MYTQEPNWFDEINHKEVEKQINKMYPDYDENPVDWDYLQRLEKRQIFFDNINDLLKKYHFMYKWYPNSQKYRIWFKDQYDFNKFNVLRSKSNILKNLIPWRMTRKLDSSGCMDYLLRNIKMYK